MNLNPYVCNLLLHLQQKVVRWDLWSQCTFSFWRSEPSKKFALIPAGGNGVQPAALCPAGGCALELGLVIDAAMAPVKQLRHPPPEGAVVPMEKSGPTTMIQAANRK